MSFCPLALPQFPLASERLIIPVVMDGELRGWQARLISGTPGKGNPKYYTMHGMKKSMALYNYDKVKAAPFVVVTEGPTKVWTFGPEACAILGNKASGWQAQKLAFWGRELRKPIVILLEDINGGGGGRKPVKHDLRDDARARTALGCAKQPGGKISDVDVQLKTRGYHRGGWRFAKQRRAGRDLQVAKTPGFL